MDKELDDGLEALKQIIVGIERQIKSLETRINRHKTILSVPQTQSETEKLLEMIKDDTQRLKDKKYELELRRWLLNS